MSKTRVEIILDNSMSMYHEAFSYLQTPMHTPLIPNLAGGLHVLSKDLHSRGIATCFHVFSDDVISGPDVGALLAAQKPRCTSIASGFRGMLKNSPVQDAEKPAVVIFISDGADSHRHEGLLALKALTPLPVTSTLLTVAVGKGFPTTTVLNELYVKYHTNEDKTFPLVFAIDPHAANCGEVMAEILEQLKEIVLEIASGAPRKLFTVADLEGMDNASILSACRLWYNEVSVRTLLCSPVPEKVKLLDDLKQRLNAADKIMRANMQGQAKPLLISSLRKTNVSVHHLSSIREKINTALAQLNKGRLFDDLTDEEKADFIAFGNKVCKLSVKAAKYRGADADRVLLRLKEKARSYTPSDLERQLTDVFHMCSLAEIWGDVRANQDLLESIDCMGDIFRAIAFFGRGLQLHPVPECAQLNPWVVSVKSLPTTIKIINTHDLYCNAQGQLTMRDETHNNLLILGGSADFLDVETHVQTFTIAGWSYYHKDARLAMAAALLVYLLKSADGLPQWKQEELQLVRSVLSLHTPDNSRWWHEFCAMLASEPRKCLVTESAELPPSIRCQGLHKFILALWCAIDKQPNAYDLQGLSDIRLALVIEFLGRSKLTLRECVKVTHTQAINEQLPWTRVQEQVRGKYLCMSQIRNRLWVESAIILSQATDAPKATETLVELKGRDFKQHYYLSLGDIEAVFCNLAQLCGISDWPAMTDDELLRALLVVQTRGSSVGRSTPDKAHLTSPMPEIKLAIATSLAAEGNRQQLNELFRTACQQAADYLQDKHCGLPRRIPEAFVKRYKDETGRDIAEDYKVDPLSRLSAVACCFPACDLFLTIPGGNEKQQRSIIKAHLQSCCQTVIPGLHACVVKNSTLSVSEVLSKVVSGHCLKQPFPSRSFGNEQHTYNDVNLSKAAQRKRLQQAVDTYNKGDSMRLYHLIERMQDSIISKAQCWSYEVFKAAFDAKYQK